MIIPGVVAAFRQAIAAACDLYWDQVVLVMHMDADFSDEKGHTPTIYGSSSISATNQFGGGSGYFDGSSFGSVNFTSTDFQITGDFAIDFWVKLDAALVNTTCVLVALHYPSSTSALFSISATVGVTPDSYVLGCDICSAPARSYSTFTHVLLSRSGVTTRLFLDGALAASTTSSISLPIDTTMLSIGSFRSTSYSGSYTKGYIDDLRITNAVARYTTDFTPPTAPFPDVAC